MITTPDPWILVSTPEATGILVHRESIVLTKDEYDKMYQDSMGNTGAAHLFYCQN